MFLTELQQTPYKNEFMFVCVDPSPSRPQLPNWLKQVPTLVVRGQPEPLTGNDVMNWLYERRLKEGGGGTTGKGASAARATGAPEAGPGEPEAYMWNEMGGNLTKSFSYVSEDGLGDSPMGNFQFLNGAGSFGTRTGSDIPDLGARGATQQRSKKEEMFDKQMEEYLRSRGEGVAQPVYRQ